ERRGDHVTLAAPGGTDAYDTHPLHRRRDRLRDRHHHRPRPRRGRLAEPRRPECLDRARGFPRCDGATRHHHRLATATLGAWSVLVTVGIFSGATQRWVTFAAAAAVTGLALAGQALEASGVVARRMPHLRRAAAPKAA